MDCLSSTDPTQIVTLAKGAQLGGSELANCWLGYIIDHAPGPAMAVMPTVELAKKNSKQRIEPLIEECPRLREKVKPSRAKDSGNTILCKEFPGGVLAMTGANSAVGLRSMPVRYLDLDEVDGYPGDVDEEGDPVKLAEARTRTFPRRKIFKVSTPTIEGRSRIWASYLESDQRKYEIPCPYCGAFQELVWKNIRWPEGHPEEAVYICAHCEAKIEEQPNKTKMLEAGRWVARNPDRNNKRHVGFHLNSLYSPVGWYSWGEAAAAWEQAKKNQLQLRSFINTVLGEPWKDKGDAPDWRRLFDRRETYPFNQIVENALFITAGVDVQKDRLEVEIVAWGYDKQSWSIDYRVLRGDTSDDSDKGCWGDLEKLLNESFPCGEGQTMPIRLMAVDSGYNTNIVYNWVRKFPANRVIATKGKDSLQYIIGSPSVVDVNLQGRKIRRGVRLWHIGTNLAKTEFYGWLRLNRPTNDETPYPGGYCHFPEHDEEYFKMLTAEQLVVRTSRNGGRHYEWEKTRDRNEALDCRLLARAAASVVGLDRLSEEQLKKFRYTEPTPIQTHQEVTVKQPRPRRASSIW